MRQITLKNIRATLTKELNNLPFEITKNGKVIAIVSEKGLNSPEKGLNNNPKPSPNHTIQENPVEVAKSQVADIVEKKVICAQPKATIPTGVVKINSYSKEYQTRKKKG